jgi:hypothetical protein
MTRRDRFEKIYYILPIGYYPGWWRSWHQAKINDYDDKYKFKEFYFMGLM